MEHGLAKSVHKEVSQERRGHFRNRYTNILWYVRVLRLLIVMDQASHRVVRHLIDPDFAGGQKTGAHITLRRCFLNLV